jgi:ABC-type cobalamin/Fe3+-siderophores transport system ATPase subunit
LCRLADNIRRLNRLETVAAPDVPQILVQRRGEAAFADLRTGLSQGEQSAAILTLALHTRAMPLIIDQPEDELVYSYVVHLIVPKILKAKFSRQILIVTHNANIPVLGDADYVIKMENRPRKDPGRTCVIADAGSFESVAVTKALIELEGGQRAFNFRRFRYAMPGNSV